MSPLTPPPPPPPPSISPSSFCSIVRADVVIGFFAGYWLSYVASWIFDANVYFVAMSVWLLFVWFCFVLLFVCLLGGLCLFVCLFVCFFFFFFFFWGGGLGGGFVVVVGGFFFVCLFSFFWGGGLFCFYLVSFFFFFCLFVLLLVPFRPFVCSFSCMWVGVYVFECVCVCVCGARVRVCPHVTVYVWKDGGCSGEVWRFVCLLVGCLTSQQQASVSQGRICLDNFTCCHNEKEVADQTFYLTQSQYTDTGPTSPSADPITPGAWQGSHWSANV